MLGWRRAATVVVLAFLASGVLANLNPKLSQAAPAATSAVLTIAPENGGQVADGAAARLALRVANTGATELDSGEVRVAIDSAPRSDVEGVVAALAKPVDPLQGYLLRAVARVPELAVGQSKEVQLSLPPTDVQSVTTRAVGTRVLYAEYSSGLTHSFANSTITRMGRVTRPLLGLATLIPLLAPANDTGVVTIQEQSALSAPNGAWSKALDAARANPSAAIALDPEVLASIRLAGTNAPATATNFLSQLQTLPDDFLRLPYGDPDLALLHAAGLTRPPQFASLVAAVTALDSNRGEPLAQQTAESTDLNTLTNWTWSARELAWPVAGTASDSVVSAAKSATQTLLLSSSNVREQAAVSGTSVTARVGGTDALIANSQLSALLTDSAADGIDGLAARAQLVGLLGVIGARGANPIVLAVPDRDVPARGLSSTLTLLHRAAWIRGVAMPDLQQTPADVATLRPAEEPTSRVRTVRPAVTADRAVTRLSNATVPPTSAVADEPHLTMTAILSSAWDNESAHWPSAVSAATARLTKFSNSVSIENGADINAIGADGKLRVVVRNDLSAPVQVVVQAKSSNGRLQFSRPAKLLVSPKTSAASQIQFRSIVNGQSEITISLETVSGAAIGKTVERKVSVQAGLDTIVAVIVLACLGALLALGVYRNITRRRPKTQR